MFAPVSSRWRNGVVERGVSLVRAACRHVFE
jgi:hypothetical protein